MRIHVIITHCVLFQFHGNKCSKFPLKVDKVKQFSLLKHCSRSSQPVVGLTNTVSAEECEAFSVSVKGLAFNYSPFDQLSSRTGSSINSGNGTLFPRKLSRKHIIDQAENFYRCHALACPEVGNMGTLLSDQRFDYYTLYAVPVPSSNTSCIPELGLFQFYQTKQNYSAAFRTCITQSRGALAHIVSETRTTRLADLLRDQFENKITTSRAVFVGLNDTWPEQEFRTSEWESLKLFPYRAWSPGYPRKHGNHSCVALKMDRSWITVDCDNILPFVCEIYTSAPTIKSPGTCNPNTEKKFSLNATSHNLIPLE